MSTTTPVTAEQLLRMPDDGYRYELLADDLIKMSPAGWKHGAVVGCLHTLLSRYIDEYNLGQMFGAGTGFWINRNPDTVLAPDISFIHRDNFPASDPEEAFWPGPPDLAVEVVSPNDTMKYVDEKVKAWLDAGTIMVWVVNPKWRNVTVYRSANDIKTLTEDEHLDGQEVVPDFRCQVSEIFAGL